MTVIIVNVFAVRVPGVVVLGAFIVVVRGVVVVVVSVVMVDVEPPSVAEKKQTMLYLHKLFHITSMLQRCMDNYRD